jgi:hypothetical protein
MRRYIKCGSVGIHAMSTEAQERTKKIVTLNEKAQNADTKEWYSNKCFTGRKTERIKRK